MASTEQKFTLIVKYNSLAVITMVMTAFVYFEKALKNHFPALRRDI